MILERDIDLIMVEVESFIERMIEEYTRAHLGERFGEVENGKIQRQVGRQPAGYSEEVRGTNLSNIRR
jgi:hypothetical protein